jgi:hypothetical protein
MLAPAWDSVVPLGYKKLHLIGYGHHVQPIVVKLFGCSIYVYVYRRAKQSSR